MQEFWFDRKLIEVIIGEVFFSLDDDNVSDSDSDVDGEGDTKAPPTSRKERALAIFRRGDDGNYLAVVKNLEMYHLVLEFASLGASFRMVNRLVHSTCMQTGMNCYKGCTEAKVGASMRLMCTSNLQMLSHLLCNIWAFSIALDGATYASTSYLDVQVRFCLMGNVHNFHLLALPIKGSHTGQQMFEMTQKVLDVICPGWKNALIGVASDGARNMTGRHSGVITYLQQAALPNFFCIWCGAHQLDLVMESVYNKLLKDDFFSLLTALIGYLRVQQLLVSCMGTVCPKVVLTRWLLMHKVMAWFQRHRIDVKAHLDKKKP